MAVNMLVESTLHKCQIFDHAIEGVQLISPDFRYLYVNNSVCEQGKRTREELLGNRMSDIYPGIENTFLYSLIGECFRLNTRQELINEFENTDGSVGHYQLRLLPLPEGVLIMSFDVTEQVAAQNILRDSNFYLEQMVQERTRELSAARDIAIRASKVKSEFLSTISHELRTPLTAILGALRLMTEQQPKLEEIGKDNSLLGIATRNTLRVLGLINDLLDMQKIESGSIEFEYSRFQVEPFMQQAVQELEHYAQHYEVDFRLHAVDPGLYLRTDRNRLMQIISNLLSNAAKFSNRGGVVDLSVIPMKKMLRLQVQDYGKGIPESFKLKVFEKFAQASVTSEGRSSGTGLGLSISRSLATHLGGSIDFVSNEGQGTTFFVDMPLKDYPVRP